MEDKYDMWEIVKRHYKSSLSGIDNALIVDAAEHYSVFIKDMFTKVGITKLDINSGGSYWKGKDCEIEVSVNRVGYDTNDDTIYVYYTCGKDWFTSFKVSLKDFALECTDFGSHISALKRLGEDVMYIIFDRYKLELLLDMNVMTSERTEDDNE